MSEPLVLNGTQWVFLLTAVLSFVILRVIYERKWGRIAKKMNLAKRKYDVTRADKNAIKREALYKKNITCLYDDNGNLLWQDVERTYTNGERVLDSKIDCLFVRSKTAGKIQKGVD